MSPIRRGFAFACVLLVAAGARADEPRRILDRNRGYVLSQEVPGVVPQRGGFGESLAAGDFDADGYDDLVVGSYNADVGSAAHAGAIFVFSGSPDGLGNGYRLTENDISDSAASANEGFGFALAAGDFDGNGYDDLAIGAPGEGTEVGSVVVWNGSQYGLTTAALQAQPFSSEQLGCGPPVTLDRLGSVLAAGDVNGDGHDDLAIGIPAKDARAGAVCLTPGRPFGGIVAGHGALYYQNAHGYVGSVVEPDDQFGAALMMGRFTSGDELDLAVGAPGEAPGPDPAGGSALIWFGKSTADFSDAFSGGVPLGEAQAVPPSPILPSEYFGQALASGDTNGDAFDELGIGAPGEAPGGAVFLFFGAAGGPTVGILIDENAVPGQTAEANEDFGSALALADLDGDGSDELIVGVPFEKGTGQDGGVIAVFPTATNVFVPQVYRPSDVLLGATDKAPGRFGSELVAGDFDGDGRTELAVSAPNADGYRGLVFVTPEPGRAASEVASLALLVAFSARRRGGSARGLPRRSHAS